MTEEMIKSITDAESQAVEIKRLATEQAAKILADAEEQAVRFEETSIQTCKAYTETQTKRALDDAEVAYNATIEENLQQAKTYCEKVLKNSDSSVSTIVRRIIGGSC